MSMGSDCQRIWLAMLLFFFSGMAGLLYEVLWMRELSLLFGATAYAAAVTLAAFFLGLAAGGAYWGQRADRLTNSLRAYGLLELGVAGTAGGCLLIVPAYRILYPYVFGFWEHQPAWILSSKFILALLALFPTAFFLGGTLPVMSRYLASFSRRPASGVSVLYAVNTLGAVSGALLAGFGLPIWLGSRGAYLAAMVLSTAVGLLAIAMSALPFGRADVGACLKQETGVPEMPLGAGPSVPTDHRSWLGLAFLSGFVTLALQVLWTRMFAQVLQNSVYTFSLLLALCLLCLALGALLASRLLHRNLPSRVLLFHNLWVSALLVALTPFAFEHWTAGLQYLGQGLGWREYLSDVSLAMVAILGPALVVLGLIFPLLFKLGATSISGVGASIGRLAAANTLGGIAGSLIAGFLFLEWVGLWASIRLLAVTYLLAALWLAQGEMALSSRWRLVPVLGILSLVSWLDVSRLPIVRVDPVNEQESVMQSWESGAGVVAVVRHGEQFKIKLDNHYTLGGSGSAEAEAMQGSLPVLLHPKAESVYMIGLGTGISAGATLRHPIRRLLVTELLPDAVEAARLYFAPWNFGLFDDPRVSVVSADGRNHIAATREKFDVIIGDLFVPWQAGAGSLYTLEHFRAIREHLREDGIYMQWLPAYQLSFDEFADIARTLLAVFPEVSVWRGDFSVRTPILGLMARSRSGPLSGQARLFNKTDDVEALGGRRLMMHYIGRLDALSNRFENVPINGDDRPVIEYQAPVTQRRQKVGERQWLTGVGLIELMDELEAASGMADDPFLSQLPEAVRRLPQAGNCRQRALIEKQEGLLLAAEQDQACVEHILRDEADR